LSVRAGATATLLNVDDFLKQRAVVIYTPHEQFGHALITAKIKALVKVLYCFESSIIRKLCA